MITLTAEEAAGALESEGELFVSGPVGRIRVERHVPFLIVYRSRADIDDSDNEALVEGEPAVAIANPDRASELGAFVEAIVSVERRRFGAFLVVEVWTVPAETATTDLPFRILAPTHRAPAQALDALERSLVTAHVERRHGTVSVEYRDDWHPPHLAPLALPADTCHIGIEVPAVHRDTESGDPLPLAHRELRRELRQSLRRGLYEFSHAHTPLRPAHHHELGSQAMTRAAFAVDSKIADVAAAFDLLLHVTPVNVPTAEADFRASGGEQEPEFLYRARAHDPDLLKRQLFGIELEAVEDPAVHHLLEQKRAELDRQLTLMADRGHRRFLFGSQALYGKPSPELIMTAALVLGSIPPTERREPVAVEEVADEARRELVHYRALDPSLTARVSVRDDLPAVMVSRGDLLIGRTARVSRDRIGPLLAHEIGVHVLTHHNGSKQPFRELHAGTAGYEALQEGLAVLWEYLVGGLDRSRLRLIAGRVIAVQAVCDGSDFVETHRLMTRHHGFSFAEAFSIAMRVHRGGGFIKDVVYLRGLMDVLDYLRSGASFDRLHLGKVALEHLGIIEELEWRQILMPPWREATRSSTSSRATSSSGSMIAFPPSVERSPVGTFGAAMCYCGSCSTHPR